MPVWIAMMYCIARSQTKAKEAAVVVALKNWRVFPQKIFFFFLGTCFSNQIKRTFGYIHSKGMFNNAEPCHNNLFPKPHVYLYFVGTVCLCVGGGGRKKRCHGPEASFLFLTWVRMTVGTSNITTKFRGQCSGREEVLPRLWTTIKINVLPWLTGWPQIHILHTKDNRVLPPISLAQKEKKTFGRLRDWIQAQLLCLPSYGLFGIWDLSFFVTIGVGWSAWR